MKYIRNLRWVYGEIVPDYILGQTTCALYLRSQFDFPDQDVLTSIIHVVIQHNIFNFKVDINVGQ